MALHPEIMRKDARIYIAGHTGLAGSAICRQLRTEGFHNLITRSHDRLDLTRQVEVEAFIQQKKPGMTCQRLADCTTLTFTTGYHMRFAFFQMVDPEKFKKRVNLFFIRSRKCRVIK